MNGEKKLTPVEYLAQHCAGASSAFQALRKAVLEAGPLDNHTCELITLGAFATAHSEGPFKTHAQRLLKDRVPVAALRQAVLVTFAATTTFSAVIDALRWIDDVTPRA